MRKLLLSISSIAFLASCSPEKKLGRLLAKNPHLAKHDTVYVIIPDTIPGINAKVDIALDSANAAFDSIFLEFIGRHDEMMNECAGLSDSLKARSDSLTKALKYKVKKYIKNTPVLTDTVTKIVGSLTIKAYHIKGGIGISVFKPDTIIKTPVTTSITNIGTDVKCELPWWVKPLIVAFIISLLGIIILLILK